MLLHGGLALSQTVSAPRRTETIVQDAGCVAMGTGPAGQSWRCLKEEGGHVLVIDGRRYGPFGAAPEAPVFSADGREWALHYRVENHRKFAPGLGDPHPDPAPASLVLQPHLFKTLYARFVVVQGRQFGPFEATGSDAAPTHTKAGWVFRARQGRSEWIFVNGKKFDAHRMFFSPDYLRCLEVKGARGRESLALGGEPGRFRHGPVEAYDRTFAFPSNPGAPEDLAFSFSRLEQGRTNRYVFERGRTHGPYQWVDHLGFSPDGLHVAFVFERDSGAWVHLDGKEHPTGRGASLAFRPDGCLQVRYYAQVDGVLGELKTDLLCP